MEKIVLFLLAFLYLENFCVMNVTSENGFKMGINTINNYHTNFHPHQNPPGGCVNPDTIPLASNIDEKFFNITRIWYVTGHTAPFYKLVATVLLGRPPQDQSELERMCLTRTYGNLFSQRIEAIFNGYGVEYVMSTHPVGRYGMFQAEIDTDPETYDGKWGVNLSLAPTDPISVSLLQTDNKSYGIWYLCSGNSADITLTTTRPFVSPQIARMYKDWAVKMNINPNSLQLLACSMRPGHQNSNSYGGWSK